MALILVPAEKVLPLAIFAQDRLLLGEELLAFLAQLQVFLLLCKSLILAWFAFFCPSLLFSLYSLLLVICSPFYLRFFFLYIRTKYKVLVLYCCFLS